MSTTATEIVYAEAVRQLDHQSARVDEIRQRSSILLAAAGVTSSFFGAQTVQGGADTLGILAILGFIATAGCCIAILLPRTRKWTFCVNAKILIEDHLNVPTRNDPEKIQRFLAGKFEEYCTSNEKNLELYYKVFSAACVCLSADIVLWLFEMTST
jgi:hypothetical protein